MEQPVSATAWLCQITKVSKGAKASRGNTRERDRGIKQAHRLHEENNSTKRMYGRMEFVREDSKFALSNEFSTVCAKNVKKKRESIKSFHRNPHLYLSTNM